MEPICLSPTCRSPRCWLEGSLPPSVSSFTQTPVTRSSCFASSPDFLAKASCLRLWEHASSGVTKRNTPPRDVANARAGDAGPGVQMVPNATPQTGQRHAGTAIGSRGAHFQTSDGQSSWPFFPLLSHGLPWFVWCKLKKKKKSHSPWGGGGERVLGLMRKGGTCACACGRQGAPGWSGRAVGVAAGLTEGEPGKACAPLHRPCTPDLTRANFIHGMSRDQKP